MTAVQQHMHYQTQSVAILGPLGTYTHEAAYQIFGSAVDYQERHTISDTLHAIQDTASIGVVPQENTIFGNVIETYDGLRHAKCGFVKGEVTLRIQHCLMVQRGVQLHEIEVVLSHEQALGQCQEFLNTKLPNATRVKTPSTASAARTLLASPRNHAAICSKVCAAIFDELEVIEEGVQKEADNFTRFYIVVRDREVQLPVTGPHRTKNRALIRIWISPSYPSGAQCNNVVQYLAPSGLNVTRIDRRPAGDGMPFRDIYFVETEGTAGIASGSHGHEKSWPSKVAHALELIKSMGGEVDLIGLW